MREPIKTAGKLLLGAGLAALALKGCWTIGNLKLPIITPNERTYDFRVQTRYFGPFDDAPTVNNYIVDENNDGTADAIVFDWSANWYTNDWHGQKERDARLMTPEMRDAATKAMNSQYDLAKLLTKDEYEAFKSQEEKQ